MWIERRTHHNIFHFTIFMSNKMQNVIKGTIERLTNGIYNIGFLMKHVNNGISNLAPCRSAVGSLIWSAMSTCSGLQKGAPDQKD